MERDRPRGKGSEVPAVVDYQQDEIKMSGVVQQNELFCIKALIESSQLCTVRQPYLFSVFLYILAFTNQQKRRCMAGRFIFST
jgi:hypothetical protein